MHCRTECTLAPTLALFDIEGVSDEEEEQSDGNEILQNHKISKPQ